MGLTSTTADDFNRKTRPFYKTSLELTSSGGQVNYFCSNAVSSFGGLFNLSAEFFLRLVLLILFLFLRKQGSFRMNIHHEDIYKYMYPRTEQEGVSNRWLYFITWVMPVLVIFCSFIYHCKSNDNSASERRLKGQNRYRPLSSTSLSSNVSSIISNDSHCQSSPGVNLIDGGNDEALTMKNSAASQNFIRTYYFADFLDAFLCHSLTILLTSCLIHFIKCLIGRPRPDMVQRCWPELQLSVSSRKSSVSHAQDSEPSLSMSTIKDNIKHFKKGLPINPFDYECSPKAVGMWSAFKSFPSGHAGYSAAACMFCCLYITGKFKTFSKPMGVRRSFKSDVCKLRNKVGQTSSSLYKDREESNKSQSSLVSSSTLSSFLKDITSLKSFKLLIGTVPFLLLSVYVGVTRIQDYRHHIEDVVVGLLLGWSTAILVYKLYYRKLTDSGCEISARQEIMLS